MFTSYFSHKIYAAEDAPEKEKNSEADFVKEKKHCPLKAPLKDLTPNQQDGVVFGVLLAAQGSFLYYKLVEPLTINPTPAKTLSAIAMVGMLAGVLSLLPHELHLGASKGSHHRPC